MKQLIVLALVLAGCGLAPRPDSAGVMLPSARAAGSVDLGIVAPSSHRIDVANGTIEVQFASGEMRLSRDDILAWVEHAARAVADYHGRFPVDYLELRITPAAGRGVPSGVAYGYHGALIRLDVGRESTVQDLASDWVLVHEMVHLAFPSIDSRHSWLKEGLATYVEPIARFRNGLATRAEVWGWLTDGLPHSLPESGDRGLDYTPTWGRTYWGGRCSACSPISRFATAPATRAACRMRCARSIARAATSPDTGPSSRRSKLATQQSAYRY